MELNVAAPVILSAVPDMPPATSSFVCGVVSPIPISPVVSIRNLSVPLGEK